MPQIENKDIGKVKAAVCDAVSKLNDGANRVDLVVEFEDNSKPVKVYGYWDLGGIMTIHIRIEK